MRLTAPYRMTSALALLAACACAETQPERVRQHVQDGYYQYKRGSYADARDCFSAALALKPGDPDLVYNLAQCHDKLGQRSQAETLYKQCIDTAPDHFEARHAWLELLMQTNREPEGRRMVSDWLRARPNTAGPYVEDAWLRVRDGDLDTARRRYQQALNLDPSNDRALAGLAALYEKLGHPERALVLYERALQAHPGQAEIEAHVQQLRAKNVGPPRPD